MAGSRTEASSSRTSRVVECANGGTVADVLDAQYPIEVNANQRGIIIGVIAG
jgi:hypothetical protein